MAQASVLTDSDIRRVFRIVETTRHAERNRLAFILSIYAGMRIGEIAALTVRDVATAQGEVRREIKLSSEQTKGSKGRTVILSERVRREIAAQLKIDFAAPIMRRSLHRNATAVVSQTYRYLCCSRSFTTLPAFARRHIRDGGHLLPD